MSKVVFNITVSLDGFVAGPNDGPDNGLGDGGDRLFEWYFNGDTPVPISDGQMILKVSPQSAKLLQYHLDQTGASIWGRRTFDIAHARNGHPPSRPCLIVTHSAPPDWSGKDSPFIFVRDGVAAAIAQATALAGAKNVVISTASILQQALNAGLVDEIHLDLVPVLLGSGVRLLDNIEPAKIQMEILRVVEAPGVTHLSYRIIRTP